MNYWKTIIEVFNVTIIILNFSYLTLQKWEQKEEEREKEQKGEKKEGKEETAKKLILVRLGWQQKKVAQIASTIQRLTYISLY